MVRVVDKDLGWQKIRLNFEQLKGRGVKIGLWGSEEAEGISVVDYATFNEFGTRYSPARPFMQTTYVNNQQDLVKFTEALVTRMVNGGLTASLVLENLGQYYRGKIQMTIREAKVWAVPNADSTVAMKGSTSPLIDKGRMVNAVQYEVI